MDKKFIILILVMVLVVGFSTYFFTQRQIDKPEIPVLKVGEEENIKEQIPVFLVVAENLEIPWEIDFLPNGSIIVTERPGTLAIIKEGNISRIKVPGVYQIGEGGLLGMALHPNFNENNFLYFYLTYREGSQIKNKVERYRFVEGKLLEKTIIIEGIPGAGNHNGGRIAFGPDGYLYITTGDAGNPQLAQDVNSVAGKILRVRDDGSIPNDNPFKNEVYSYGHRNAQGLAFDDKGRLWATEHGRSGILSGLDELNLIEKGKNYGWPIIQGDEKKGGMETPVENSGPSKTWAPAGAVFWEGSIFFAGLRGQSLYEAKIISEKEVKIKVLFKGDFGRIRAVVLGPDGYLYISTSNTDGRGNPSSNDDKIIRINPRGI